MTKKGRDKGNHFSIKILRRGKLLNSHLIGTYWWKFDAWIYILMGYSLRLKISKPKRKKNDLHNGYSSRNVLRDARGASMIRKLLFLMAYSFINMIYRVFIKYCVFLESFKIYSWLWPLFVFPRCVLLMLGPLNDRLQQSWQSSEKHFKGKKTIFYEQSVFQISKGVASNL